MIFLLCITLLLSACTQGEEETQDYSGNIGYGKTMGYEYTITKEKSSFSWKIGYKGDLTTIKERIDNKEDLQNYMMAINESESTLSTVIISLSYFLIVAVISFLLYKRNKKLFKECAGVIALASILALYIAIDASFDLSVALKEVKFHYLSLPN